MCQEQFRPGLVIVMVRANGALRDSSSGFCHAVTPDAGVATSWRWMRRVSS